MADLVTGLRSIIDGDAPSHSIPSVDGRPTQLSFGEQEVLDHLNSGASPAKVAKNLHLSLHTVRSRIKGIHRKLDVNSQNAMIAEATRRGLLVPPS